MLNVMIYSAVIVNIEDTDSSKRLLRLSGKNKLSQSMVSRNLFIFVYITLCLYILLCLDIVDDYI